MSLTLARSADHARHVLRAHQTWEEPAHDMLAAEAFAMPAPDPELTTTARCACPRIPSGIREPHDVLAAEEFPMPAARPGAAPRGRR